MFKYRLYWNFYKSTLIINYVSSLLIASFTSLVNVPVLTTFCISIMSGGVLIAVGYKEMKHPVEYYFYYNRGISKYQLMAFTVGINILIGIFILIVDYYVTSA